MEQLVGRSLGRYRIEELRGEGGMGAVFRAHDTTLDFDVAIKVMHPHIARRTDFRDRFLQEARTAARLDHPGIVRAFNFGQEGVYLYIVMEFIPGPTLRQMMEELRAEGRWIRLDEVIGLTRQICLALDCAHDQGVLHRDIKPENIMLKPRASEGLAFQPVLTDLGLAKLAEGGLVTAEGVSMGTPAYMSPEQASGEPTDARSDVYSLGILLFELSVGRLPFPVKTISDAIRYHTRVQPPAPRTIRPDLPAELEGIILRALAKDPDERYNDAGLLAELLGRFRSDETVAGPAPAARGESLVTRYRASLIEGPGPSQPDAFGAPPSVMTPQDRVLAFQPDGSRKDSALRTGSLSVGRSSRNDLVLADPDVSRHHLRIDFDGQHVEVTDLRSTNGTILGSNRLLPGVPQTWTPGQALTLGKSWLRLERAGQEVSGTSGLQRSDGSAVLASEILTSPGVGRVGVFVEERAFSVDPGDRVTVPLTVINQGSIVDSLSVRVRGLPESWFTAPPPARLLPGGNQAVSILFHPPGAGEAKAGRYTVTVRVCSQDDAGQVAQLELLLTVGSQLQWESRLVPERFKAGQLAQVALHNRGNTPQRLGVAWEDRANELVFDPPQSELSVPAGGTADVNFRAAPRKPRWLGGKKEHPIQARVTAPDGQSQSHHGEVITSGRVPIWLLALATLLLVGLGTAGAIFLPDLLDRATPTPTQVAGPAEPTETPEPEIITSPTAPVPTEPGPTEAAPTEAPTEPSSGGPAGLPDLVVARAWLGYEDPVLGDGDCIRDPGRAVFEVCILNQGQSESPSHGLQIDSTTIQGDALAPDDSYCIAGEGHPAKAFVDAERVVAESDEDNNTAGFSLPGPLDLCPQERTGAWVDTVIFTEEPDASAAVSALAAGDIDVYAYKITEPEIAARVFDSAALTYKAAYGNSDEITFMPSTGREFNDGRLNPFYSDQIREAMNWLIDRDYICQEISGGLAVPRYVPVEYASRDAALLADVITSIELEYAYDPGYAEALIEKGMLSLGAERSGGQWVYNGQPVVLTALIRVEDERLQTGDYVSNMLEDIGFTVRRVYSTSAEASPCWLRGDPDDGCAHFYTGGWVTTAIVRDSGGNFSFYYTPAGLPLAPWQAYSPSAQFQDVATRLNNGDFRSMDERKNLMGDALHYAMADSQRIWLKDEMGIAAHAANVTLAADLSSSIYGSWLWAQTLRFDGREGGTVNVAVPSMMGEPWNPLGGTNWAYDMMPMRGIQDSAVVPDPFTGLMLPNRLAEAEVTVQAGTAVQSTLDWVTLKFASEINVPRDAWSDWDARDEVFVTANERFGGSTTARAKVVVTYEDDLFDTITWHDGSPLDLADFVMFMILQFDRAKPESPYYDERAEQDTAGFMESFKGWRIVSQDPLAIEYYTDDYAMDAENYVTNVAAAYPSAYGYAQAQAAWHSLVPGLRADAAGQAAFSSAKAEEKGVDWISYISGPAQDILKEQLSAAQNEGFIPFAPTLANYITPAEAELRYANLQAFSRRYAHFYIGTGPFFLMQAFPVEGTLSLQRWDAYPDESSEWDEYTRAPIPEVLVDGPGSVSRGSAAEFDIYVELEGDPYPSADVTMVRFLVINAVGEVAHVANAKRVSEGYYTAALSGSVTGALPQGSNQLTVVVVSSRAIISGRDALQFVTQ